MKILVCVFKLKPKKLEINKLETKLSEINKD